MNVTHAKLLSGYGLGAAAMAYAIYAGSSIGSTPTDKTLNVLLCVAGGVFGWITGMLITPGADEKKDFSKVGGALMTFVTGFLLAKFEPLLDMELKDGADTSAILVRSLLFAVSFGVGALFVFVGRKYWRNNV